jgi:hypothetical protein
VARQSLQAVLRADSYGGLGGAEVGVDRFAVMRSSESPPDRLLQSVGGAAGGAQPELARLPLKGAVSARNMRTMRLALDLEDSAPALRMADKLEAERRAIQREIDRLTADYATSDAVANITEKDIAAIIRTLSADLQNPDNDALKGLISKIIIDLETNEFQVHYTIKLASPKGIELSLVA